jgi:AAA domain/FG-GAP-like repeat
MDDKPRGPLGPADWAAFLANQKAAGDNPPPREDGAPPIGDEPAKPNFRSLKTFCAEFRPISYAVDKLMREGSLYTLTGRTGEGKTAFLVPLALAVATGRGELIGRKVKKGPVAFCTAENPDDLRMRLMIACFVFNIDVRAAVFPNRPIRQPRRRHGTGDFNDDGHSDILWQNTDGQAEIWEMNGTKVIGMAPVGPNPGPSWKAIGTGDFNDDGHSDILWQNTDGQAEIWEVNGTKVIGMAPAGPNPGPSWLTVKA